MSAWALPLAWIHRCDDGDFLAPMAFRWERTFDPCCRQTSMGAALALERSELYDYARRTNELDLHGYSVASAREIALEFVKAAWEAGHDQVVLIHGARAAHDPRSELALSGYGGIKEVRPFR